ncbi:unnamed protein product [Zymoseptoria tritici ST99CH_3D7]|uniref:Uncharacterized protein n=1 Tax=Zymoseptoria tritici (strain ST99CH_3D7) TaxID=1276538 RepID=A0A1X7RE11_ZYMT9|nr:unnamed protein product [Zymoseptoria tritici ST99CH_3D7]
MHTAANESSPLAFLDSRRASEMRAAAGHLVPDKSAATVDELRMALINDVPDIFHDPVTKDLLDDTVLIIDVDGIGRLSTRQAHRASLANESHETPPDSDDHNNTQGPTIPPCSFNHQAAYLQYSVEVPHAAAMTKAYLQLRVSTANNASDIESFQVETRKKHEQQVRRHQDQMQESQAQVKDLGEKLNNLQEQVQKLYLQSDNDLAQHEFQLEGFMLGYLTGYTEDDTAKDNRMLNLLHNQRTDEDKSNEDMVWNQETMMDELKLHVRKLQEQAAETQEREQGYQDQVQDMHRQLEAQKGHLAWVIDGYEIDARMTSQAARHGRTKTDVTNEDLVWKQADEIEELKKQIKSGKAYFAATCKDACRRKSF